MALGGAHGILCCGCGKDITSQTANRCNILKPSYSKTLQVWKRLVVERFEELNVDVDIKPHLTLTIIIWRVWLFLVKRPYG